MKSTLKNSNEIICKHRNLRLQVPGKVGAECGLIVYINVKFEIVIINSFPTKDLNANLHLILTLEMLKVKVKDNGNSG